MAAQKYPGRADDVRRAILAVAQPGKPLPRLTEIGRAIGISQCAVSWHLERLRDEWRIVTRTVWLRPRKSGRTFSQRRTMVLEVRR